MTGIEMAHFFEDKPQWLRENTIQDSEKITSKNLDFDKFLANIGFYQR